MTVFQYPTKEKWAGLCQRPTLETDDLETLARQIFDDVKRNGDKAVAKYNGMFDGNFSDIRPMTAQDFILADAALPEDLKRAIALAKSNIEKFHASQIEKPLKTETSPGVVCWRESRPIDRVGLYIPGGSAPLFSTVLMLAIPAKLAGCKEIILCSPADASGKIAPEILFAASLTGVTQVFGTGGIQAIAAMSIGTDSIPKADKIFGPGNQYVTAAKTFAQSTGTAIDLPAGPSEVLVIADASANAAFVASDLLSQAEHGPDSQVVLLSESGDLISGVLSEINKQLKKLPRRDIASKALSNSKAILLRNLEDCMDFSNEYAPEHLIIATENAEEIATKVTSAGSVFIGKFTCESAGDYASGTNHTLPTNGFARSYSGVSLDSFIKKITFQKVSAEGLKNIGPAIEKMAAAEGLEAHKNAVSIRLKSLKNV